MPTASASSTRAAAPASDFSSTGSSTGGQEGGFWSSLKEMFVPDEDRHAYGEGISRGGYLLTAEVDEDQADEACRILEQSNSVDFDERESAVGAAKAGAATAPAPARARSRAPVRPASAPTRTAANPVWARRPR
jgi:hypothetical protein